MKLKILDFKLQVVYLKLKTSVAISFKFVRYISPNHCTCLMRLIITLAKQECKQNLLMTEKLRLLSIKRILSIL